MMSGIQTKKISSYYRLLKSGDPSLVGAVATS